MKNKKQLRGRLGEVGGGKEGKILDGN